jgi:hypothetical protein
MQDLGDMQRTREVGGLAVLVLAVAACLTDFLLEAHVGFSLWDGGYLWYGVQRVLQGEVPIRDFMAYDPGRYYWAAALLRLFDSRGIIAVRAATMAFSALGVMCAGLLVLHGASGSKYSRHGLAIFGIVACLLWLEPWWKGYDVTASVILIVSLTRLLKHPCPSRFLVHGVVIGLVAVLGRNHGLYGAVACVLAMSALIFGTEKVAWGRCIPAWIVGMVLGFSPIIVACIVDRSFAGMFWESIRYMVFEFRGTNLPLPVPWPWTVPVGQMPLLALVRPILIGCTFIALPVFSLVGAILVLCKVRKDGVIANPIFAASVFTAIPYLNVAFSRADISHLAQAVYPCLIGVLVYPWRGRARNVVHWVGLPLLTIAMLWIVLPLHASFLRWTEPGWRQVEVGADGIWMDAATATLVDEIKATAADHIPAGDTVLAVPVWPGVYALLGVRSPVWEIYPILPRNDTFQDQEIARLQKAKPGLVLIYNIALDDRDQLLYVNTHPRIWKYINTHYHRVPAQSRDPQLMVYLPEAVD